MTRGRGNGLRFVILRRVVRALVGLTGALQMIIIAGLGTAGEFRAGCHAIDVTPVSLPAIMNGGFLEKSSSKVNDPLFARSLALSDGTTTIGLSIVDSCMIPRDLCDQVKKQVEKRTGISKSHLLFAATHTHSAPSVMEYCLGTRKDNVYAEYLVPRLVEGLVLAVQKMEPARVGWAVTDAPEHTHCRRWLRKPGVYDEDPFGETTVRAMMHPGYQNADYLGPAGPVDTSLSLLSIQSATGKPLCVLANYSMHYFGGTSGFSADYFGDFARNLEEKVRAVDDTDRDHPFVAIMSQGTSGDLHWMDYGRPQRVEYSRQHYAAELSAIAWRTLEGIEHRSGVELAMAEAHLDLQRRLPSSDRLQWAQSVNETRGARRPRSRPEVYAEQATWIAAHPRAELVLQAIRIGDMAIAAIPNEVYSITGLKLKAQSPLQPLVNLELANGAEGYIPPEEQHFLGGYTTWPARTAGLETGAEARIVDTLLDLLEQISPGQKRRPLSSDLYSAQQRREIARAQAADNNRQNRSPTKNRER